MSNTEKKCTILPIGKDIDINIATDKAIRYTVESGKEVGFSYDAKTRKTLSPIIVGGEKCIKSFQSGEYGKTISDFHTHPYHRDNTDCALPSIGDVTNWYANKFKEAGIGCMEKKDTPKVIFYDLDKPKEVTKTLFPPELGSLSLADIKSDKLREMLLAKGKDYYSYYFHPELIETPPEKLEQYWDEWRKANDEFWYIIKDCEKRIANEYIYDPEIRSKKLFMPYDHINSLNASEWIKCQQLRLDFAIKIRDW